MPTKLFSVVKKGEMSGVAVVMTTFQSNVGMGFKPSPDCEPVMAASLMLSGAIQVIQEK